MIRVEKLTFKYPGTRALDNVSFNIGAGSLTALVGPNGAGKTTLLQCLAALIVPFSGRISINDIDIAQAPHDTHRRIGYLPDFFGLYDKLSVTQALTYFAMAQKVDPKAIGDRVRQVITQMDLAHKTHAKIGSLSRGMRQRLAIGQALVHDPEILLLDEPASGLDPEARLALADLFLELSAQGKTLIVSSHILAELDQYANSLLILNNGRLVDSDIAVTGVDAPAKLHIELLETDARLDALLEREQFVNQVQIEDRQVVIDFTGDEQAQCDLLQRLVNEQVKVQSFYVQREGVQEQYLKAMDTKTKERKTNKKTGKK